MPDPTPPFADARQQLKAALADPALRTEAHYLLWEVCQACGDAAAALQHLDQAIRRDPVQTRPRRADAPPPLRTVLALAARGDFQANLPLSLLLDDQTVLHTLWLDRPGLPLPPLPPSDCVFIAISEDRRHAALLRDADRIAAETGLPTINSGARIAALSRDGVCALLDGLADCVVPTQQRVTAAALRETRPGFPCILRPATSHAGIGLVRIGSAEELDRHLDELEPHAALFVAPFVGYSSTDGLFRKCRIVFVDREPFPVHMAIHDDWAVWYYNAGMERCAVKRAEEERFLRDPAAVMGARAIAALRALGRRLDLDYVGLDCAVLPDGRLLVFEVETGMVVHDRDPPDLFPGKGPAIERIVSAVNGMIDRRRAMWSAGAGRAAASASQSASIVQV